MSTITQALLVAPVQLTAADTAYYTTPINTAAKIGRAVFFNADTLPHVITMNITNAAAAVANEIMIRTLAAKETYVSPELSGQVLPPGYALHGLCDTGAVVNLFVSGQLTVG